MAPQDLSTDILYYKIKTSRLLGYLQVRSDKLGPAVRFSHKVRYAETQNFPLQHLSPKKRIPNKQEDVLKMTLICIKQGSPSPSPFFQVGCPHQKPLRGCSSSQIRFLVLRQLKFLDDACQSRLERRPALPETWRQQPGPPAETMQIIIIACLSELCHSFQSLAPHVQVPMRFAFYATILCRAHRP